MSEAYETETDALYTNALAAVGLMALHLANPSRGRTGLLEAMQDLSSSPDYPAILRWIVARETSLEDAGAPDQVTQRLRDVEEELRRERFLGGRRAPGRSTDSLELFPDTVSEGAKGALAEFVKEMTKGLPAAAAVGLGITIGTTTGVVAAAALGAAAAAGTLGLTKLLFAAYGQKGDYAGGMAHLRDADLRAYDEAVIAAKFEKIWATNTSQQGGKP